MVIDLVIGNFPEIVHLQECSAEVFRLQCDTSYIRFIKSNACVQVRRIVMPK